MSETVKIDPRYYAEGATWEHDLARRNRNSRALAWIVAAVMTIVAIAAISTVALLVPLKTYEPYMVVVDKTTGFVEVKRPMAEGSLSQDEAVTMFNVVRYIKARETYDPRALKDNFDLAQLLSSGDAAREFTEIYSPANPQNPVKIFGTNTEVAVTIKSVTFPNNRTALVRFSTEQKSATNVI
ncbi:MAG: virB8 family protein, partial [Beijerinckiaceae bacterium]